MDFCVSVSYRSWEVNSVWTEHQRGFAKSISMLWPPNSFCISLIHPCACRSTAGCSAILMRIPWHYRLDLWLPYVRYRHRGLETLKFMHIQRCRCQLVHWWWGRLPVWGILFNKWKEDEAQLSLPPASRINDVTTGFLRVSCPVGDNHIFHFFPPISLLY